VGVFNLAKMKPPSSFFAWWFKKRKNYTDELTCIYSTLGKIRKFYNLSIIFTNQIKSLQTGGFYL